MSRRNQVRWFLAPTLQSHFSAAAKYRSTTKCHSRCQVPRQCPPVSKTVWSVPAETSRESQKSPCNKHTDLSNTTSLLPASRLRQLLRHFLRRQVDAQSLPLHPVHSDCNAKAEISFLSRSFGRSFDRYPPPTPTPRQVPRISSSASSPLIPPLHPTQAIQITVELFRYESEVDEVPVERNCVCNIR